MKKLTYLLLVLLTGPFAFSFGQGTADELGENLFYAFQAVDKDAALELFPSVDEMVSKAEESSNGMSEEEIASLKTKLEKEFTPKIEAFGKKFDAIIAEGEKAGIVWNEVDVEEVEVREKMLKDSKTGKEAPYADVVVKFGKGETLHELVILNNFTVEGYWRVRKQS